MPTPTAEAAPVPLADPTAAALARPTADASPDPIAAPAEAAIE
jgi:hypothetical protein